MLFTCFLGAPSLLLKLLNIQKLNPFLLLLFVGLVTHFGFACKETSSDPVPVIDKSPSSPSPQEPNNEEELNERKRRGTPRGEVADDEVDSKPSKPSKPSKQSNLAIKTESNKGPGRAFTVFRPEKKGDYPVLFWGNATMAPGGVYASLHEYVSKHGFVVVAGASMATGEGQEMIKGIRWITAEGSDYDDYVDKDQIGVFGHSQGAATSVVVAAKFPNRVKAMVSIQPDCNFWVQACTKSNVSADSLIIAGGNDPLVPHGTVKSKVYDNATGYSVFAKVEGLDHISWMMKGSDVFGKAIVAWFEGSLKGIESSKKALSPDGCRGSVCKDTGYRWTITGK